MFCVAFRPLAIILAAALLLNPLAEMKAEQQTDILLTLPPEIYAVAGEEMSVYFANTIRAEHPAAFRFEVKCDIGVAEERRWSVSPTSKEVGEHVFSLSVSGTDGERLGTATATLIVAPADARNGTDVRLLLVGDSLTHASLYPKRIAALMAGPGNPGFEMLGTHRPKGVAEGVAHEGYGGWTWQRFVEHYEPNPDGTHRKKSSPFVFLDEQGNSKLDVERYIDEHCNGEPPNVIVFKLGINDCFHANPDNADTIEKKIDAVFAYAERLIAEFRSVAPNAILGICLTTPGNSRDAAFDANYKGRYTRWGWKRIQHRLVQRQLEHFLGREQENVFVIPTELNLDTLDGYPANNGVHPNATGYNQIGTSIYAWLKYRLSK